MAALKSAFVSMGFKNVRTVLASGNVIFETSGGDPHLDLTISRGLDRAIGFPVRVVLRTVRGLRAIIDADPFKSVPSGPDVKLYVTFLARKSEDASRLKLPTPPKGVRIVRVGPGEIFSAVGASPGAGTPEFMAFLEKAVGREITTRNWRTVRRIAGL